MLSGKPGFPWIYVYEEKVEQKVTAGEIQQSVILKWSKFKKWAHKASIYSLSVTQNWRKIWISIQISLEFEFEFVEPNLEPKFH